MSFPALIASIQNDPKKSHISVSFDLKQNQIGQLKMALNKHPNITSVSLPLQNLGKRGLEKLLPLRHVEELDLSQNDIDDSGVCFMAEAIKDCKNLTKLNLSGNSIALASCHALGLAVEKNLPPLKTLILQNCGLNNTFVTVFCSHLQRTSKLKKLDLQGNDNISILTAKKINSFLTTNFKSGTKRQKALLAIVEGINPARVSTQKPRRRRRATLLPPSSSTEMRKPTKRKRESMAPIETFSNNRHHVNTLTTSSQTSLSFESFDVPLSPEKRIRID